MNEEELKIINELKDNALMHIKKLGHKPGEWIVGPRPHISPRLQTKCESCKREIRLQKSLRSVNKKAIYIWEVVAGEMVLGEFAGRNLSKFVGNEKSLCTRFTNML